MSRRAVVVSSIALALTACTLFTNLDGLSGGPASSEGGATAADASSDGPFSPSPPSPPLPPSADGSPGDDCAADGLIAFWHMDEGAGAMVADCTAHHLDGVVSLGNAAWATGKHGGAFSFDGKTCLDMGTSPAFGFTTAFTVAYWISPHSFPSSGNAGYVIAKRTYGAESGWRVGFRSAMPAVEVGIPGGKVELVASSGLVAGKWAHVAATFTPNHLSIYVGGVLAGARADAPDAVIDQDVGTHVGCSADANATVFANADIDDLRVYSRALSDAEIAAIAQ